jgi:hypothetical protein
MPIADVFHSDTLSSECTELYQQRILKQICTAMAVTLYISNYVCFQLNMCHTDVVYSGMNLTIIVFYFGPKDAVHNIPIVFTCFRN